MFRRLTLGLFLTAAFSTFAIAQAPPGPAADQPDPQQQVRETFQTIIQNMRDKGLDPADFFGQLRDGADPADVEKQLIAKGVVDQATLDQLHGNMQKVASGRVRDQLEVTDTEWATLEPMIQKVQAAAAVLDRANGRPSMGGFVSTPTAVAALDELAKANRELRAATKDPSTSPEKYAALLKAFRDARDAARAELDAARKELISVLTVRQEGVLTSMGILE